MPPTAGPPLRGASLWAPITLGGLTLPNRLVMAAMGTAYPTAEGAVTERLVRYLARRAAGGVGLVVTEAAAVDASGAPFPGVLRADDDRLVPGLARLAAAVHAGGAAVALQLYHAGRQMSRRVSGREPVGPSAVPCALVRDVPRALGPDEVGALVERFAEAAARARAAGFDAVEIHGAHGYLIHQFLSPLANRRADAWGGDRRGRARFALEVVRAVRARVGPGFPLLFKLSAADHLPGGLALEDTLEVAAWLEAAGVDALVVSAGTYDSFDWIVQPLTHPPACLRAAAARFRARLGIPVTAVGRINDPALAEDIVQRGDADLVAVGRALLADPDLPRKTQEGRRADVRPCITCNECLARLMRAEPIECAVNPETGREADWPPPPAAARRHVVVVGGGPAGMQAALVARQRGHEVTLLEAAPELGGRLRLADRPAHKREIAALTAWLRRQIEASGARVRTGTRAGPDDVAALAPDAVVLATGARTPLPEVPGVESRVVTAEACLAGDPGPARDAAVLGGGNVACEVAGWLAERGWRVVLLAPGRDLARELEPVSRRGVLARLQSLGVRVHPEARVREIARDRIVWTDAAGTAADAPAALVVAALDPVPIDELRAALLGRGLTVHAVGDCAGPGGVGRALRSATEQARAL